MHTDEHLSYLYKTQMLKPLLMNTNIDGTTPSVISMHVMLTYINVNTLFTN